MRWKEFTMPTRFEFEAEALTGTYGRFIMEPFERGYALTVGNALRRSLLSSIEGSAPVSIKLDGVQHEFSTIPGVQEDTIDIILNIRQLRVRLHGTPPKSLILSAEGEKKVSAKDFEPNPEIEILNPDLHVATLTEKSAKLNLEVEIEVGRGFGPAEKNKRPEAPIGVIPLDVNFGPVTRARYDIENTRVGQITDFERLVIEIWTDGRVSPERALDEAAFILKEHFLLLAREGAEQTGVQQAKEVERIKDLLEHGIEDLDLSVRSLNSLHNESINNIADLVGKTDEDLLKFSNFGRKSLEEIKAALALKGLSLGMSTSAYLKAEQN